MAAILTAITDVWTSVSTYILSIFTDVTAVFYNSETGLTFIGVLAIIMSGVSLCLLVWNLIRSFFPARG